MALAQPPLPRVLRLLGAASGAAFLVFAVATFVLFGRIGVEGPEPSVEVGAAIHAHEAAVGAASFTSALAGLALAAFVAAIDRAVRSGRGPGLPLWGVLAGAFWAFGWVLAGVAYFGAVEISGYYESPELAKGVVLLAWEGIASPAMVACSAALVAAVAWAVLQGGALSRWYGVFSAVASLLVLVGAASLAVSFSGMLGVVFLPIWLLVTVGVLLGDAWTGPPREAVEPAPARAG